MKVFFHPQVSCDGETIDYTIEGETITVTIGEIIDTFDFSSSTDGEIDHVETTLPVNPIISAKRENGILSVELLNWITNDSPHEDKFPEWKEI